MRANGACGATLRRAWPHGLTNAPAPAPPSCSDNRLDASELRAVFDILHPNESAYARLQVGPSVLHPLLAGKGRAQHNNTGHAAKS